MTRSILRWFREHGGSRKISQSLTKSHGSLTNFEVLAKYWQNLRLSHTTQNHHRVPKNSFLSDTLPLSTCLHFLKNGTGTQTLTLNVKESPVGSERVLKEGWRHRMLLSRDPQKLSVEKCCFN